MESEPKYNRCGRCGEEGTPQVYEWWCWSCGNDYGVDYANYCEECGGECEEEE